MPTLLFLHPAGRVGRDLIKCLIRAHKAKLLTILKFLWPAAVLRPRTTHQTTTPQTTQPLENQGFTHTHTHTRPQLGRDLFLPCICVVSPGCHHFVRQAGSGAQSFVPGSCVRDLGAALSGYPFVLGKAVLRSVLM